jgi:hypothetical protein
MLNPLLLLAGSENKVSNRISDRTGSSPMNPNHFWRMFEDEWFTPKYRLKKLLGAGAFGAVFLADEVISCP